MLLGAAASLSVMVAGVGLGFLAQLLVARVMGVGAFGLFVFIFTWVRLVAGVGRLGIDSSALRFVATYREARAWGLLRGFLGWGRRLSWGVASVLSLPFLYVAARAEGDAFYSWLFGAVSLPLFVAMLVEAGLLQGLRRPVLAQLGVRLAQPLLLMALVGGVAVFTDMPPTASQAMAAGMGAVAGGLALTLLLSRRALPVELDGVAPEWERALWWRVSSSMLFITAVNLVQTQTDIVMLGLLRDTDLSGVYSAASKVAELVAFGLTAVNAVAGPMIAGLHARGQRDEIQRLLRYAAWGGLAFVVPTVVVLAWLGPWVLSLFGEAFGEGYRALLILTGGQLFNALCGSVGLLLMMTGHQGTVAGLTGASALLNVLLNLLLIPTFGMEGAATATATTTVAWNLALLWIVIRRFHFNPTVLPLRVKASANGAE